MSYQPVDYVFMFTKTFCQSTVVYKPLSPFFALSDSGFMFSIVA